MWFVAEAMTDVGVPDAVVTSSSGMAFLERVGKPVYETLRTLCLNRARQRTSLELQMQVCFGRVSWVCLVGVVVRALVFVIAISRHELLKLAPCTTRSRQGSRGVMYMPRKTTCSPVCAVHTSASLKKRGVGVDVHPDVPLALMSSIDRPPRARC